jgi:plastocyanin
LVFFALRAFAVPWVLLVVATTAEAGTIRGRVTLKEKGGRPAESLREVVVFLDGVPHKARPTAATMAMRRKTFEPRVVVIPVGGTVSFPNEDPILHNVFSVTKSNPFDLQLYKRPKSASWTFQNPGIVKVYCNIHPQMSAVVVVLDNPYYATASEDGSFELADLAAGRYSVHAWHERGGESFADVTVPAAGVVEVALSLDASTYKWIPHKNKYGRGYDDPEKY